MGPSPCISSIAIGIVNYPAAIPDLHCAASHRRRRLRRPRRASSTRRRRRRRRRAELALGAFDLHLRRAAIDYSTPSTAAAPAEDPPPHATVSVPPLRLEHVTAVGIRRLPARRTSSVRSPPCLRSPVRRPCRCGGTRPDGTPNSDDVGVGSPPPRNPPDPLGRGLVLPAPPRRTAGEADGASPPAVRQGASLGALHSSTCAREARLCFCSVSLSSFGDED